MSSSKFHCPTCNRQRSVTQRVDVRAVPKSVFSRMQADLPEWDGVVTCRADVRKYRVQLLRETIEAEHGPLLALEREVLSRMENSQRVARQVEQDRPPKLGERVADRVAAFGGSWPFLILFGCVILAWMGVNIFVMLRPFDPYPFILLNLVLSCLAAVQAPVIMMSQNRQSTKDRIRSQHDYEVNLKAELEIQLLNEKLDHLLLTDWQRLLEIQELQLELLQEVADPPSRS